MANKADKNTQWKAIKCLDYNWNGKGNIFREKLEIRILFITNQIKYTQFYRTQNIQIFWVIMLNGDHSFDISMYNYRIVLCLLKQYIVNLINELTCKSSSINWQRKYRFLNTEIQTLVPWWTHIMEL